MRVVLLSSCFSHIYGSEVRTITNRHRMSCTKTQAAIHPASLVYRNVISVTRVLKRVIKFKLFASSNKGKLVITAEARPKSPKTLNCSSNGIVSSNLVRCIRERHSVIK